MAVSIEADWERLEAGTPEDRACFAAIGTRAGDVWLTQAEDTLARRLSDKVHLSACRLAEWMAWNWWRLRWEPRKHSTEWAMAHCLPSIGGGYVWPNIGVISDGERVIWDARPTHPTPAEPLRYTMSHAAVVRASEFESSINEFIARVRGRLAAEGITGSNLDAVCPHEALEDFLAGDSSPELLADAADHFRVSELAVRTLLVNHGRLSREDLDSDPERQIAA